MVSIHVISFHLGQDERELKRQRRKQSNRESARRSRLRKQAECEELGGRLTTLSMENMNLQTVSVVVFGGHARNSHCSDAEEKQSEFEELGERLTTRSMENLNLQTSSIVRGACSLFLLSWCHELCAHARVYVCVCACVRLLLFLRASQEVKRLQEYYHALSTQKAQLISMVSKAGRDVWRCSAVS